MACTTHHLRATTTSSSAAAPLLRNPSSSPAPMLLLRRRVACCSTGRSHHVTAAHQQQHSIAARSSQHTQQQMRSLAPSSSSSSRSSLAAQRLLPRAEPADSSEGKPAVQYNTEFGYSRKDVLLIIVALIAAGVLMYEGLQALGMDAGMAGNWVQLTIFLGICVGWVSTYLWRVANKKMTYAQQLQMYESAVMQKRLEEMTEAELQQLMGEVEADKARLAAAKEAMQKQRQQQQQQQ